MGCCIGLEGENEAFVGGDGEIENVLFIDRLVSLDANFMNSSSSIVVFDAIAMKKSEASDDKDTLVDASYKTIAE